MTAEQGHDGAQYLAGSPVRIALLRTLREDPQRPATLTASVEATRTTVQRILAGFRERNWVVKRGAAYHVTPTGQRVHNAYETLLTEIERGEEYGQLAADLERAGADIPPKALAAGELTAAGDRNPFTVVERLTEILSAGHGSEIRAVSPVVIRQFNDAAAAALDADATIDLVIDRKVVETSISEFGSATERALGDENAQVYVAPETLSYGLLRSDDIACVTAYDQRNNPRCLLESDESTLVEWVDRRIDSLIDDASPLTAVVEES